ncbi:MAG: hypothetical protein K8H88_15420, partial [Sandaracinaceae bacterium]|nr:hypothetical protein [Sandaracinaceae bacterium]
MMIAIAAISRACGGGVAKQPRDAARQGQRPREGSDQEQDRALGGRSLEGRPRQPPEHGPR